MSIHHYRRPWNWTDAVLREAQERLDAWRTAGAGDAALAEVRAALDDDLDVPAAIAAIDRAATEGEGIDQAAALIGIDL